eukprot:2324021-Rhodomonas_salina.1
MERDADDDRRNVEHRKDCHRNMPSCFPGNAQTNYVSLSTTESDAENLHRHHTPRDGRRLVHKEACSARVWLAHEHLQSTDGNTLSDLADSNHDRERGWGLNARGERECAA